VRERVLSAFLFGIPALAMLIAGGAWMILLVVLITGIALVEFSHLVARRGHRAFGGLMLLWLALFVADRVMPESNLLEPGMALLLLATMFWALIRYRQGVVNALTGFALTVAGSMYIGWSMVHYIGIRALPDGLFWTLSVVLSVWLADTGAYLVGRRIGRTPLMKDVSPKKTWEGFVSGIAVAVTTGALLPLLWHALGASNAITPLRGVVIGLIGSIVGTLGDLSISMVKRYVDAKDSSNLIPGHGGFLDRLDSIIVTGLLSYYYLRLVLF